MQTVNKDCKISLRNALHLPINDDKIISRNSKAPTSMTTEKISNTIQKPATRASSGREDLTLFTPEGKAELEMLDRQADHEYVPMDVFVDRETIRGHFQASSIRSRWTRTRRAAA